MWPYKTGGRFYILAVNELKPVPNDPIFSTQDTKVGTYYDYICISMSSFL